MRYTEFESLISAPRMAKYLTVCRNDTRQAMRLYRANIRLSQEFLALLGVFEVVLRNKIDRQYKAQYPATAAGIDWLLNSILPGGMFTTQDCSSTLRTIVEAYSRLGSAYSHDKLVAALSFGFWKFMFAGNQFRHAGSTLLSIFPAKPPRTNQGTIYQKLDKINAIRNRVAHHEPICFDRASLGISTAYARNHYTEVVEVLQWMNINTTQLFYGIDKVLGECDYIDRI